MTANLIERDAIDKEDALAMVYEYIDGIMDTLGVLPLFHVCISDSDVQVIFNNPTLAEMRATFPDLSELDDAA